MSRRPATAAKPKPAKATASPPHPGLSAVTLAIPPDAGVDYVSARDDVLLLRVNAVGRAPRVDLAVLMPDPATAKVAIGAFFDADGTLSGSLSALGIAALLHLDLDAGAVLARLGDPTTARPLAVIAETARGSAMPEARLSVIRDALQAWASAAASLVAESVAPSPAPLPAPRTVADAVLTVTPYGEDGSGKVEIARGDASVSVGVDEVPSLLAALSSAFPGCLGTAATTPARPAPVAGMTPVERAERVILARLFVASPKPLAWASLRAAVEGTGLPAESADAASSALTARKAIAWKGETLVLARD